MAKAIKSKAWLAPLIVGFVAMVIIGALYYQNNRLRNAQAIFFKTLPYVQNEEQANTLLRLFYEATQQPLLQLSNSSAATATQASRNIPRLSYPKYTPPKNGGTCKSAPGQCCSRTDCNAREVCIIDSITNVGTCYDNKGYAVPGSGFGSNCDSASSLSDYNSCLNTSALSDQCYKYRSNDADFEACKKKLIAP